MRKQKLLIFVAIIAIALLIIELAITYSKYNNDAQANLNEKIGQWVIKVNNKDITAGTSEKFEIDEINWVQNTNVKEGKAAPRNEWKF